MLKYIFVAALLAFVAVLFLVNTERMQQARAGENKLNKWGKPILNHEEESVIVDKGTERAFSGDLWDKHEDGTYTCRRCGLELFKSTAKFDSKTGWPSFDEFIPGAVKMVTDKDGVRTEIVCARCEAHLGHVFTGEGFTPKNKRYCVNSVSLDFVPANPAVAIFAGGCFWGVEQLLQQKEGVISVVSGYSGGEVKNPTYQQVSSGSTGHAESVRVTFDPAVISYRELAKYFLEIHDPTQLNRQGPDIGNQYRSEIFYTDEQQKKVAEELLDILRKKGYDVKTKVSKAGEFYPAEDYHQDYYARNGKTAYCHFYTKRF